MADWRSLRDSIKAIILVYIVAGLYNIGRALGLIEGQWGFQNLKTQWIILLGLIYLGIAYLLYEKKDIGWWGALIFSLVWMYHFPLGTIIGVLLLVVLMQREIREEYNIRL